MPSALSTLLTAIFWCHTHVSFKDKTCVWIFEKNEKDHILRQNVSKAIFMTMYAVWVRARKNGPRLGNKRLSIRVPSFEKEKVEKLAKNTQKAVFITIL